WAYKWAKANKKRREYQNAKGKSKKSKPCGAKLRSRMGYFSSLLRLTNSTDRGHITAALSDNLDGLTGMLPILRTGEAIILGEAVKLPMRTTIEPPPIDRRPDSQDPIVFDEVSEDASQNPGGWGINMESNPNYKELVEAWRAQNPRIAKVILKE
ncbi:ATP-binding protein, partial [Limnohabitans sp. 2KL-17]|uniref:ATP-binding protein n=1 Tax=Limnohabitans sp. 2KL-17 TaxID=1100704 RepID=UPI0018EEA282